MVPDKSRVLSTFGPDVLITGMYFSNVIFRFLWYRKNLAPEAFNQLATNLSILFYRETLRHRRLENTYIFGFAKDIRGDSIGKYFDF